MKGPDTAVLLLAEALGLAPDAIGPDTRLGAVPAWDSLAHLRLVMAIEARLGRQLLPAEIVGITGLDAVAALLPPGG